MAGGLPGVKEQRTTGWLVTQPGAREALPVCVAVCVSVWLVCVFMYVSHM